MDSLDPFVSQMRGRLAELQAKAIENDRRWQAQHDARLAALPPGTCELCYGTGLMERHGMSMPCSVCHPPVLHADGVPFEFRSARLDNYQEDSGNLSAITKARRYLDGDRDLYLFGGVGAGKTRLACSLLNEQFLRRKTCYFARVPMVLYALQPGRDAEEGAALERRLFTTSLLVLDDVGAERDQATDFTRRTLLMIYEQRGDAGKRTIWTGNKSLDDIAAMQDDDRLASRIAGRADVVKLSTPDQRLARRGR